MLAINWIDCDFFFSFAKKKKKVSNVDTSTSCYVSIISNTAYITETLMELSSWFVGTIHLLKRHYSKCLILAKHSYEVIWEFLLPSHILPWLIDWVQVWKYNTLLLCQILSKLHTAVVNWLCSSIWKYNSLLLCHLLSFAESKTLINSVLNQGCFKLNHISL